MPFFTVITVAYNSEKYINQAINSVLNSSFKDFEYIILDDNSQDNTWEIINNFKDQRIISIKNEVNLGEYKNRNHGISLASGKYIIFIDGDDLIMPNGLEYFHFYLQMFFFPAMVIQKEYYNNVVFPIELPPNILINSYINSDLNFLASSFASTVFRTDVLQAFKLSEKYKTGDDEIRLRIAIEYNILFIPGWVTWPRETPDSATSNLNMYIENINRFSYETDILNSPKAPNLNYTAFFFRRKKEILKLVPSMLKRLKLFELSKLLNSNIIKFNEIPKLIFQTQSKPEYFQCYNPSNPMTNLNMNIIK